MNPTSPTKVELYIDRYICIYVHIHKYIHIWGGKQKQQQINKQKKSYPEIPSFKTMLD